MNTRQPHNPMSWRNELLRAKMTWDPVDCPSHHSLRATTSRIPFTWLSHGFGLYITCYVMSIFTLHAMPLSMILPCNCDPCLHLPMIHHFTTHMCICMLGGDPCCYCHVYHLPHALAAILLISCLYDCEMSCALYMPTICTHDMLAMIPSSTLHLRTTSLLDLITMITCLVA